MTGSEQRNIRKTRVGRVVQSRMDKSIVVLVERRIRHPLYGKEMRDSKKLYVHDEENVAREGDIVRVTETRPLSKTKRWRLVEIMEKAED